MSEQHSWNKTHLTLWEIELGNAEKKPVFGPEQKYLKDLAHVLEMSSFQMTKHILHFTDRKKHQE